MSMPIELLSALSNQNSEIKRIPKFIINKAAYHPPHIVTRRTRQARFAREMLLRSFARHFFTIILSTMYASYGR